MKTGAEAVQDSPVMNQFYRLASGIETLECIVNDFEAKLTPVLRQPRPEKPAPPLGLGGEVIREEGDSDIALKLRDKANIMQRQNERLQAILKRVEL